MSDTVHSSLPSLLEPAETAAPPAARRRLTIKVRVPERLRRLWEGVRADPARYRRAVLALRVGACAAALGLGAGAYFVFRPVPQPDYLSDPLNDVFNYTLLTDEFNKLSVEKRLELIGQLVGRLKSMSSGDSVLMAGFAAGIAGAAREQIEENMSRLAIDLWDRGAKNYSKVPAEEREAFLEKTFADFTRTMEAVAGQPSEKSDEERVAEARREAQRERERMRQPGRQPGGEELGAVFGFLNGRVGGYASPSQKERGALMMRDMARHFRGQDISTGKPK